jgi:hypothetical protein
MFPAKDPCKIKPVLKEKVGDSVKTSAKDGEMTPVKQHWKFLAGSQLCKPTGEQKGKITKKTIPWDQTIPENQDGFPMILPFRRTIKLVNGEMQPRCLSPEPVSELHHLNTAEVFRQGA